MRKKIIALALALTCTVSALVSSAFTKAAVIHETELEEYIMEEMASAHILGMGISIVSADKELYCAAYGAAKEPEADYVLGSISKSFTAAGIMRMVEDGDLTLEDTVSDYLPEYKAAADITIQELLNHTSGIAAEQHMNDLQVTGKRGDFQYANANYNLLGEIIEEISGMNYEEYISDNIIDPLEMTSTYSMRMGSDLSDELLPGYKSYFGFPFASKYEYDAEDNWMQVPSGYMISDIKDMGRYLQMYLNSGGEVLSKESIDVMLHNGVDTSSDNEIAEELFPGSAAYAMGWMEKEVNGHKILYHAGNVENFMTMMVLIPEKDLGITMMFNSMDYLVGKELVQNLQEGIISIELEQTPGKTESNTYLTQHGIIDAVMLIAVLGAWMPIFLMGVWSRRRRNRLLSVPGLLVDVAIHIVLPTVLLCHLPNIAPTFMLKRFVPDLYYVIWTVILSLYLGAVIKLITGIVLAILGPKAKADGESVATDKEENKEAASEETVEKQEEKEVKEEKPVKKQEEKGVKEEKPVKKQEEKAAEDEKSVEKQEEKAAEKEKSADKTETITKETDEIEKDKAEAVKTEEIVSEEKGEAVQKEAAATEENKDEVAVESKKEVAEEQVSVKDEAIAEEKAEVAEFIEKSPAKSEAAVTQKSSMQKKNAPKKPQKKKHKGKKK